MPMVQDSQSYKLFDERPVSLHPVLSHLIPLLRNIHHAYLREEQTPFQGDWGLCINICILFFNQNDGLCYDGTVQWLTVPYFRKYTQAKRVTKINAKPKNVYFRFMFSTNKDELVVQPVCLRRL